METAEKEIIIKQSVTSSSYFSFTGENTRTYSKSIIVKTVIDQHNSLVVVFRLRTRNNCSLLLRVVVSFHKFYDGYLSIQVTSTSLNIVSTDFSTIVIC